MKRTLLTLLLILPFAFASCEKQDSVIGPEADEPEEAEELVELSETFLIQFKKFDGTLFFFDEELSLSFAETIVDLLKRFNQNPAEEGTQWRISETIEPMLTTLWDQYEPFYNYCPKLGRDKDLQAPAGCFTLAVAQLLAYYEYPPALADFPLIKTIKNREDREAMGTPQAQEAAARFIKDISTDEMMNPNYVRFGTSTGSFSLPSAALRTLRNLGYENIDWEIGMNTGKIIESLKEGHPVLASSMENMIRSHAWVIDGYIRRDLIDDEDNVVGSEYLLHCNWGWNGKNNGYFKPCFFDTRAAEIADNLNPDSRDYLFWIGTNVIFCNAPTDN